MKPLLTEIRDWTGFAFAVGGGSHTIRVWLRDRKSRDVTIQVPAATAVASMPTPAILNLSPARGTGSASVALTTGTYGWHPAVLDSMAELFPYEFPPN
jgi:hypothetical protein